MYVVGGRERMYVVGGLLDPEDGLLEGACDGSREGSFVGAEDCSCKSIGDDVLMMTSGAENLRGMTRIALVD